MAQPLARFEAVRALALIGDPRAIPALMAFWKKILR